jgi:D-tyrosyl-tRNA(Tyr) deacylase
MADFNLRDKTGKERLIIAAEWCEEQAEVCFKRIEYVLDNANTPNGDPQVFVAYGGYLTAAKAFREKAEQEG